MRGKFDGQNLIFIVMLALIVMLSYCSIPRGDKDLNPWEKAKNAQMKSMAEHQEASSKKGVKHPVVVSKTKKTEKTKKSVVEPAKEKSTPVPAPAKEVVHKKTVPSVAPEAAAPTAAVSGMPDIIAMKNSAYPKHKKPIVLFAHKEHAEAYGIGCGECHHDDSGEPRTELKPGDAVEGCIACHSEPGKAPSKLNGKKLTKEDKLEYHADALHRNCIACHKEFNKKNNTKAAPSSCNKCHDKTKTMPASVPAVSAPEKAAPAPAAKAATPVVAKVPAAKGVSQAPAKASSEKAPAAAQVKPSAAGGMPDIMRMENSANSSHKKPIVLFAHKEHAKAYGIGCGECHHDDSGEPLANLKEGDEVENCIACHSEVGKAPGKIDGKKLTAEDKLQYRATALHRNCIPCHKAYNKKNTTKAAPATCNRCHDKNKTMPAASAAKKAAPAPAAKAAAPAKVAAPAKAAAPAATEAPASKEVAPVVETKVADVFDMKDDAYKTYKKGIVQFPHKKHIADYGLACGECHHDADHNPLNNLKMGDDVEKCIACHSEPGKAPRKKGVNKLDYHANALHDNCIPCHKTFNNKNHTKAAPTSCGKCHPKK